MLTGWLIFNAPIVPPVNRQVAGLVGQTRGRLGRQRHSADQTRRGAHFPARGSVHVAYLARNHFNYFYWLALKEYIFTQKILIGLKF